MPSSAFALIWTCADELGAKQPNLMPQASGSLGPPSSWTQLTSELGGDASRSGSKGLSWGKTTRQVKLAALTEEPADQAAGRYSSPVETSRQTQTATSVLPGFDTCQVFPVLLKPADSLARHRDYNRTTCTFAKRQLVSALPLPKPSQDFAVQGAEQADSRCKTRRFACGFVAGFCHKAASSQTLEQCLAEVAGTKGGSFPQVYFVPSRTFAIVITFLEDYNLYSPRNYSCWGQRPGSGSGPWLSEQRLWGVTMRSRPMPIWSSKNISGHSDIMKMLTNIEPHVIQVVAKSLKQKIVPIGALTDK